MSKFGYIDKIGRLVIPPQFDTPGDFTDGLAAVEVDGKYIFIDKQGATVDWGIPLQYEYLDDFSEGLAAVAIDGKYGYIDRNGTIAITPTFESAEYFSDGLALVMNKSAEGLMYEHYIDISGEKTLSLPDDRLLYSFSEGLAQHGVWNEKGNAADEGYIDSTGAEIIPTHFAFTSAFSDGYAYVKTKEEELGFIDKTGQMVLESTLRFSPQIFTEGLIGVEIDRNFGYLDKTGSIVIEPKFDRVGLFSEGLAPVAIDAKYGFIDKTGEWVIEPRFKEAYSFSEGLAPVMI